MQKIFTKEIYQELGEEIEDTENIEKILTIFKSIYKKITDNLKKFYVSNKKIRAKFKKHLDATWQDQFEMLLMYSQASKEILHNSFDKKKKVNIKGFVALNLFAKAIQTYDSICILLNNGYADSAYALWRSLYEISVILEYLMNGDKNTLQMFYEHSLAKQYLLEKEAREQKKQYLTTKLFKNYEAIYFDLSKKYDMKLFINDYGWNYKKAKKTTFHKLAQSSKEYYLYGYYKKSCEILHSSPFGTFDKISKLNTDNKIFYSPSDYGLSLPGQNCIITMTHIISTINDNFLNQNNNEIIMFIEMLEEFCLKSFAEIDGNTERHYGMNDKDIID